MVKRILNEEGILDVIWGATLLGGGGGGSMQSGIDLLRRYQADHPEQELAVPLYQVEDMAPQAYAAVTAGMGAPTAIKGVDFSAYATNAFVALREMAARMDPPRTLEYSLSVELGGFNTFVPMLISLVNGIPFLDADGAGRAVPALDTLLLHINGCDTSPLAMADGEDNQLTIKMKDPRDAHLAEEIGRHICMAFQQKAGLSGWMVRRDDLLQRLPCGTVTLSEQVGHVLRTCASDVFDELDRRQVVHCHKLTQGRVQKIETVQEKGFDYGKVHISGYNGSWTIYFQNENLLICREDTPVMTVPDIICAYDLSTGQPLTNADLCEGMEVSIGAIQADGKWWQSPDMPRVWRPFLENIGYTGQLIPFAL